MTTEQFIDKLKKGKIFGYNYNHQNVDQCYGMKYSYNTIAAFQIGYGMKSMELIGLLDIRNNLFYIRPCFQNRYHMTGDKIRNTDVLINDIMKETYSEAYKELEAETVTKPAVVAVEKEAEKFYVTGTPAQAVEYQMKYEHMYLGIHFMDALDYLENPEQVIQRKLGYLLSKPGIVKDLIFDSVNCEAVCKKLQEYENEVPDRLSARKEIYDAVEHCKTVKATITLKNKTGTPQQMTFPIDVRKLQQAMAFDFELTASAIATTSMQHIYYQTYGSQYCDLECIDRITYKNQVIYEKSDKELDIDQVLEMAEAKNQKVEGRKKTEELEL